eukprot:GGOE01002416.1.p1 GENE.GGOE01002416.1~~GGOE01002416.1.p1  ORF type:complete len:478 (+),score=18.21 GGOE01002416.1:64-1497(+)
MHAISPMQPQRLLWFLFAVLGIIFLGSGSIIYLYSSLHSTNMQAQDIGAQIVVANHAPFTLRSLQMPIPFDLVPENQPNLARTTRAPAQEQAGITQWHLGICALLGALSSIACLRPSGKWTVAALHINDIEDTLPFWIEASQENPLVLNEGEVTVESLEDLANNVMNLTKNGRGTTTVEVSDNEEEYRDMDMELSFALLLKEADAEHPPKPPNGYWDCDTEVHIDYFKGDPHDQMLTSKGYKAVCLPVLPYENLFPSELPCSLRSDFGSLYALVVLDARVFPALQWAINHYFAGTLVCYLRRAQAVCPVFAPGADLCRRLREAGFVDVYGDEVEDAMDLLPLLQSVGKERHIYRTILLGDVAVQQHPIYEGLRELDIIPDAVKCYEELHGVPEYLVNVLQHVEELGPNDWIVLFSPWTVFGYMQLHEAIPAVRKMKVMCVGDDTRRAFKSLTYETELATCPDSDPARLAVMMAAYDC